MRLIRRRKKGQSSTHDISVEAGCKTVIGSRCNVLRRTGSRNILGLRSIHTSRRLDEFWKERLNSHAARNDTLALAA